MEKYTKSAIALLLVGAFALPGCLNSDADNSVDESVKVAIENEARQANDDPLVSSFCLYDDRKTESVLTGETGQIMALNAEEGKYFISIPKSSFRIDACNLPDDMKVDGMQVTFSAEIKEIYDHERWAAHPAKLISIVSAPTPD